MENPTMAQWPIHIDTILLEQLVEMTRGLKWTLDKIIENASCDQINNQILF
jgi:hypothetical protein